MHHHNTASASSDHASCMSSSLRGLHPGIFRPPPPSSPVLLPLSKDPNQRGPRRARRTAAAASAKETSNNSLRSPPVLIPRRQPPYVLAGQIELSDNELDSEGVTDDDSDTEMSDTDCRRTFGLAMRRRQRRRDLDSTRGPWRQPTSLFQLPDRPAAAPVSPCRRWGGSVAALTLTTIGDVVGRVWQFCKDGAFRGFYAGGGRGYGVRVEQVGGPLASGSGGVTTTMGHCSPDSSHRFVIVPRMTKGREGRFANGTAAAAASLPAAAAPSSASFFDDEDVVMVDADLDRRTWAPSPRTTKRKKTTPPAAAEDDLSSSWPMVDEPAARKTARLSGPSMAGAFRYPPAPIASRASGASLGGISTSSASFASPSKSSSSSSFPRKSKASSASFTATATPSPRSQTISGRGQGRAAHGYASTASARRPATTATATATATSTERELLASSPRLTPEARRLAARRLLEERDADAHIEAVTCRLQDMIRQGEEALCRSVKIGGRGDNDDDDDDIW